MTTGDDRVDVGLTHIALAARDLGRSIAFYERYAEMHVVHRRRDPDGGSDVVWLSDRTRPFVIVLIERDDVGAPLGPLSHLGVACASREIVDRRCEQARREGVLRLSPMEAPWPVGYFALLADPDGHTLELSFGQQIDLTLADAGTPAVPGDRDDTGDAV